MWSRPAVSRISQYAFCACAALTAFSATFLAVVVAGSSE